MLSTLAKLLLSNLPKCLDVSILSMVTYAGLSIKVYCLWEALSNSDLVTLIKLCSRICQNTYIFTTLKANTGEPPKHKMANLQQIPSIYLILIMLGSIFKSPKGIHNKGIISLVQKGNYIYFFIA